MTENDTHICPDGTVWQTVHDDNGTVTGFVMPVQTGDEPPESPYVAWRPPGGDE